MSPVYLHTRRVFFFRSRSSTKGSAPTESNGAATVTPAVTDLPSHAGDIPEAAQSPPAPAADALKPADHDEKGSSRPTDNGRRRFTWLAASFASKTSNDDEAKSPPTKLSAGQEKKEGHKLTDAADATPPLIRTRSQERARQSAMVLRDVIVGPSSLVPVKAKKSNAAELEKAKAQLLQPKTANKVIEQLRQLPSSDEAVGTTPSGEAVAAPPKGPIHAVCLLYTDKEAHEKHFAKLVQSMPSTEGAETAPAATVERVHVESQEIASVVTAPLTQLRMVFSEINVESLMQMDLGIGEPGDGPGILSGAVPTAETIINGVEQITPQLMALGYATGKAVLPDHTGIYPPTDRMSVITYWWGFEVVMPRPSIAYLQNVPSVAHAVMNFLTALAIVQGGVREILPFVRYISQFVDTEFKMIKEQDKGKGVICAATWIMPAALVPRPWDFSQPPAKVTQPSVTAPADITASDTPVDPATSIPQGPVPIPAQTETDVPVPSAPSDVPPTGNTVPLSSPNPAYIAPASAIPVSEKAGEALSIEKPSAAEVPAIAVAA
ncbi:hypothetical protein SCP_0309180 [Sparassis crispa]|uniref:Uncharacterized protein n=1 Tax=Sparassis crispa TaxID=139825 RepID=A0A401GGE1_9APHY|nr:hypothetical protein SCP_0309180 [Sparassis crispa]GBE81191.1 hypothetical protein SCP_0309180 [Sparassis crispa]